MAEKTLEEKSLSLGLANPGALWDGANKATPTFEGVDITEPAPDGRNDVSPVVKNQMSDFADDMMQTGRRGGNTGNDFYPNPANFTPVSSVVGNALPVPTGGADGNIYKEAPELSFTGGTYQETNTAVGVTPNFFTSDADGQKLSDLIDKTGSDSGKLGSDLSSKKDKLKAATSTQLSDRNDYSPDGSGPASPGQYEELNPKSTVPSDALADELYKGGHPGGPATGHLSNIISKASGLDNSWSTNTYKPTASEGTIVDAHKVGDSISPVSNGTGNVFASTVDHDDDPETPEVLPETLKETGLGVPDVASTPGTYSQNGQKLGTFFEQDQIDEVLDKTGGVSNKKGSDLFAPIKVGKAATSVQTQLGVGNIYKPDVGNTIGEYESVLSVDAVGNTIKSTAEDIGIPGEQNVRGAHSNVVDKRTPEELAKEAYDRSSGAPGLGTNTNYPVNHGDAPNFTDPNTHVQAGELDNFFKKVSDFTFTGGAYRDGESTPGVGNSFYTVDQIADLQITAAPNDLMSKAEKVGEAEGLLTEYTQTQLADNNPYDPSEAASPYSSKNTGADKDSTDQLYVKDQSTLGKFEAEASTDPVTNTSNAATVQKLLNDASSDGPTDDYLGDNREATHSNTYHPDPADTYFDSNKVGDSIAPTASGLGKVFASSVDADNDELTAETAPEGLQSSGLGVPKSTGTPGANPPGSDSGQILGTFFTQAQLNLVLDKTGGSPALKGHDIFSQTRVIEHNLHTALQLTDSSNPNTPGGEEHVPSATVAGDFIWPKSVVSSNTNDVNYPGRQPTPGVFEESPGRSPVHNAYLQQTQIAGKPTTGYLGHHPYHPQELQDGAALDPDVKKAQLEKSADTKIISGEGDAFFAADTSNIEESGLGLPSIDSAPGSDFDNGQTLGTFFTQDQVTEFIDKTGGTPEKLGSKLPESAESISEQVQVQLGQSNKFTPASKHTTNLDFVPHDVSKTSFGLEQEVTLPPGDLGGLGVYDDQGGHSFSADSISTLQLGDEGSAKLSLNTHRPEIESSMNDAPTLPKSAGPSFTDKSDLSFAQDTEMVPSPGVGPNFFTDGDYEIDKVMSSEDDAVIKVPMAKPLTSDSFDPSAFAEKVQLGLDNSQNPYVPGDAYLTGDAVGSVATFDFPAATDENAAGPEKLAAVFTAQQDLGKFEKSKAKFLDDGDEWIEAYTEIYSFAGAKSNEYGPSLSIETGPLVETPLERRSEIPITPGDEDRFFVNDQGRSIDGSVGTGLAGAAALINKDKLRTHNSDSEEDGRLGSSLVELGNPKNLPAGVPAPGKGVPTSYLDTYKEDDDPTGVMQAVLDMLKNENLYSPSEKSPFIRDSMSKDEGTATQGLFTLQRVLGKFLTAPDPSIASGGDISGTRVTADDMSHMANAALVRATGDYGGSLGLLEDLSSAGAVLANPLEQMGLAGVDLAALRFKSMATGDGASGPMAAKLRGATGNDTFMSLQLGDDSSTSTRLAVRGSGLDDSPYNGVSHSQLNNYLEPFGNGLLLDSVGMLYIGVLSIAAMMIAGLVIQEIASNVQNEKKYPKDGRNPAEMRYGRYQMLPRDEESGGGFEAPGPLQTFIDEMYAMFRIPNTDNDFGDCVGSGMLLMIGFPGNFVRDDVEASMATGVGLIDFAFNLFKSPAYYANFMRQIIMSGQRVVSAFAVLGGAPTGVGALESFFPAVDELVNSQLYQFIMISAMVGDANIKSLFGPPGVSIDDGLYDLKGLNVPLIPRAQDLSGDSKAVSNMVSVARMRQNVSRFGGNAKNPLSLSTFPASSVADSRLTGLSPIRKLEATKDNVRKMEMALDAEYMPFYFHDLRTYEIISMPAFVTSFDEQYAVNYNSINSYGRQDPVRIHSNTDRTINLTFKLIAFGPEDYTSLWYTVNKLVTMLYPQYSKGVQRTLKGDKEVSFIQPFSQVPAASPVIRIRLGDVLKSNYSTTALRSLFGYTEEAGTFKYDGMDSKKALGGLKAYKEELNKEINRLRNLALDASVGYPDAKTFGKFYDEVKAGKYRFDANGPVTVNLDGAYQEDLDTANKYGNFSGTDYVESGAVTLKSDSYLVYDSGEDREGGLFGKLGDAFGNTGKLSWKIKGTFKLYNARQSKAIKVKLKDITVLRFNNVHDRLLLRDGIQFEGDKKTAVQKAAEEKSGFDADTDTETWVTDAQKFFNENNNAIVRSFNSTRGKGLAGVITNMALDYSESTWEVDSKLGKAPKSVSITMGFAPIYDLPVGLDYMGRTRALSHPTGKLVSDRNDPHQTSFGGVYDEKELEVTANEEAYSEAIKVVEQASRRGAGPKEGPGIPGF